MTKAKIKAEIVGHSLSPQGDELISVLCTFPRIILAEVNTHRMLSKNTSSSRAIPFKKMVEAVQNNPFIPIAWQKEHTGMQGTEYLVDRKHENAVYEWLKARDFAVKQANIMNSDGVTKQLCNRLLEPFMWTTMLITGSKEGWDNFFKLRCPQYKIHQGTYKSKKEALKYGLSNGELKNWSDLDWLQNNEGQAEIHIMDLAEKIYDAVNESTPEQLNAGQWHIPMISDLESLKLSTDDQIKLSVGRAANTSYTVVGDGKELTLEQAIKIHDKCKELNHSSVFEHCARAMSDEEYLTNIKGKIDADEYHLDNKDGFPNYVNPTGISIENSISGWCRNFKGFLSYRSIIENER